MNHTQATLSCEVYLKWSTKSTRAHLSSILTVSHDMADSKVEDAPVKTYTGSCHCGAVEFEVTHPDIEIVGVSLCNCI